MLPRSIWLAFVVGVVVVIPVLGVRAQQQYEPPFEVRFPQDPVATEFTDTWGEARSGGRHHRGTDLYAPKLTPVYSIGPGTVTGVRHSALAGRYLSIEHPDGWSSYYMHLNNDMPGTDNGRAPWALTVAHGIEPGAAVVGGQFVGWSGDSGNAETSPAHTHFELHYRGRAINPYPYLRAAYLRDMSMIQLSFRDPESMLFHTGSVGPLERVVYIA